MKKLVLIIVVVMVLSSCSSDGSLTKVSLMLDYTPNTNHTGIYIALDKGYYIDEGIDLDVLDSSTSSTTQAIASQSVDFGISYEEDITLAHNEGVDNIESIYSILKENTSGFVSYANKGITSPEDFKGKTYCGWGSEVEEAIVKQVALLGGVSEDEFTIAMTNTDFLRSNPDECDIFWEFEGWALQEANVENIKYNYIPLKDLGYDFYSPVIATTKEYALNNPKIVQGFVNATIKGYEYAANNPEEAAQIFLKYNSTYDESFILASQKFVSQYYVANNSKAGYQEDEVWESFTRFLYDSSIISNSKMEGMYTNEYVNNYYES